MINVGIIGGAGYTAGELIRILVNHPKVDIDFIYSTSNAGNPISDVHQDLIGTVNIVFTDIINSNVDLIFLCLGHGNSTKFLTENNFSSTTKIIDLSSDFRLIHNNSFNDKNFIYGLPEFNKNDIMKADYVANPGCFATAIQLAILPLIFEQNLTSEIHVNAVTGATGAGSKLSKTNNFAWRDNNFSHYKPFTHQHLDEIKQTIHCVQKSHDPEILFVPNRGNFSRGIFATVYTEYDCNLETAFENYTKCYENTPFTFISKKEVHLKQVVNTNKCVLHLHKHNNKLLITSCIDNLLKGASGQAVQNMNLMFGFDEGLGLQLKANLF